MAANTDTYGSGGAQGSSALYKYNTSPNTRTAISQKVRILSPVYQRGSSSNALRYQLGVVSSFTFDYSRDAEAIRGVGFGDQIAERVPGVTQPVDVALERTLLYLSNGHQAFGYAGGVDGPVRSLAHHRWPFDMEQQLVFSQIADEEANIGSRTFSAGTPEVDFTGQAATGAQARYSSKQKHRAIITFFEACWMTAITGANVTADSSLMNESITAAVTDIHDLYSTYGEFMPTGNDPTLGQLGSVRYSNLSTQAASNQATDVGNG